MSVILSVKSGTKNFGRKRVLDGVEFELPAGRIIGLLGPNGAGKTTILNTVMGLYRLDSGEIEICGETVGYKSKRLMSYLPDTNHLFSTISSAAPNQANVQKSMTQRIGTPGAGNPLIHGQ